MSLTNECFPDDTRDNLTERDAVDDVTVEIIGDVGAIDCVGA